MVCTAVTIKYNFILFPEIHHVDGLYKPSTYNGWFMTLLEPHYRMCGMYGSKMIKVCQGDHQKFTLW